jgi:hypothetical protein
MLQRLSLLDGSILILLGLIMPFLLDCRPAATVRTLGEGMRVALPNPTRTVQDIVRIDWGARLCPCQGIAAIAEQSTL